MNKSSDAPVSNRKKPPLRSILRHYGLFLPIAIGLVLAFFLVPLPNARSTTARADARQAQLLPYAAPTSVTTVDLSGTWSFTPAGGSTTTIQVPGGGWYKQGFTSVSEATYVRSITLPASSQAQVYKIEFGAVNHQATLSINGRQVGTTVTAFTPAVFDITPYVTAGQTYTLSVDVKGRNALKNSAGKYLVPDAAEWSEAIPQGIFRSAALKIYPQTSITDAFIRTSVANDSLTYDVSVSNNASSAQTLTLSGSLSSWNGSAWSYPSLPSTQVTVAAKATTTVTVGPVHWGLGTGSYWWPNVPYVSGYRAQLHVLTLVLSNGNQTLDSEGYRFGFREITQGQYWYLNGVRVNFRGDNLQGADYDRINYGGGKGDAYDTYPGFLPPSSSNPGWPQAVDNYERLNYNVVRIHQEPASPYMLDTADEMGFMIIDESAIRGSSNLQDFIGGHDNMVNHVKALVLRDRNHPSVVRWSQSNEAGQSSTDSAKFETDLYNAINGLDGTRPISADGSAAGLTPESFPNFTIPEHYDGGFGTFTSQVHVLSDRPFGQGEYIWPSGSTVQGFTWFATSTQAMRQKDASDLRPYAMLSAWAGIIPGVRTTDFVTEEGRNPIYGANNLANPWSNSQIQRNQAAFNPVLVADESYWTTHQNSNSNGDWPVQSLVGQYGYNQSVSRTLTIYNDTFSGTQVAVNWAIHINSATGTVASSGNINATVPLGSRIQQNITFSTPGGGSRFYLVLTATKGGATLFQETGEYFNLPGTVPPPTPQPTNTPTPPPNTAGYAVNAGGTAAGSFMADAYSNGGSTNSTTSSIDTSGVSNPAPQAVYQTERYGNFTYNLPGLMPGAQYTVRLHFAEIYWTSSGQRLFNVSINGQQVLTNFDVYATAGAANKAVVQQFTATADASGQIAIQFTSVKDNAKVNGIEVMLSSSSTPTPTPTPTVGTTPTPTPTTGITPTPTPTSGTACSVQYGITNQWAGGFGASVTINNIGTTAMNGWTLKWTFANGQTISQLWNGSVTQSGSNVSVTNASYNGTIAPGGNTNFGFNGSWNGSNSTPTAFTLNGTTCTVV